VDRALASGTDGRLLPAAAPGARGASTAPSRGPRALQPAFVSDAAAEDADFWRKNPVELEDSPAVAAAVPGARQISERTDDEQKKPSPFVDDAVKDFLAEETEP